MGNSDGDLFVGDQVFQLQLGRLIENLRAPRIAVLVANLFQLLDDHARAALLREARIDSYSAIRSRTSLSSLSISSIESCVRR